MVATSLSGCVVLPIPHTVRIVPALDGVVTVNGVPAAGLKVFVHKHTYGQGPECPVSEVKVSTDAQGRFHFDEVTELRLLMMMGDPLSTWAICITGPNGQVLGWRNYAMGYAEPKVSFACELTDGTRAGQVERGVCKRVGI